MPTIDMHCHFFPKTYVAEALRGEVYGEAGRDAAWRGLLRRRVMTDPAMDDVDLHLEAMEEAGTEIQVLSAAGPSVYFQDPERSLSLSRLCNETLSGIRRKHPDRFRALASVPIHCGGRGLDELTYALDDLGLDGVLLGSNVCGRYLDSPEFAPFFEEADRRRLLVFVHPMAPPAADVMGEYNTLPIVGFIFDTTLSVTRLIFSGVFERFPRIRMVVAHLGAAVPYLIGRMDRNYHLREACREHIPRLPSHYLRRLYLDSIGSDPEALAFAAGKVGADRIVFGTDYPFVKSIGEAEANVRESGLENGACEGILKGNALGLLHPLGPDAELPGDS